MRTHADERMSLDSRSTEPRFCWSVLAQFCWAPPVGDRPAPSEPLFGSLTCLFGWSWGFGWRFVLGDDGIRTCADERAMDHQRGRRLPGYSSQYPISMTNARIRPHRATRGQICSLQTRRRRSLDQATEERLMARVWVYDRMRSPTYAAKAEKAKSTGRKPPGRWQVSYYDKAGKQRVEYIRTSRRRNHGAAS